MSAPLRSVPDLPNGLPRRAWRVDEVAQMLGVSKRTVYRLVEDGDLAHIPARSAVLIPVEEFERYMREAPQHGVA